MNTAQKINFITNRLKKVDGKFLEIVHAMFQKQAELEDNPIIGYDVEGVPLFAKEAEKLFENGIEEAKNGNGYSLEALQKDAKSW